MTGPGVVGQIVDALCGQVGELDIAIAALRWHLRQVT